MRTAPPPGASLRRILALLLLALGPAAGGQPPVETLIGRLLLLAFPGTEIPQAQLREFQPAGFLFYPGNIASTGAVREITRSLQAASDRPLLFAIDQEGGPFSSYRVDDATLFPSNMSLAAAGDPERVFAVARASGAELRYAGFTMMLGPVVDVMSNPDNPIIGIRSFGADPLAVGSFGRAYLAGLEAAGIAAVAKHFPGHGDTAADSHTGLPLVERDRAQLGTVELPPFRAVVEAGIPAVMTAHVVFPALERGVPATLSEEALSQLLRDEIGFDGLVMTDLMDMAAITANYDLGEAAVRSVLAGSDLILLGADIDRQRQVHRALLAAYRAGRLSEARIREAALRVAAVAERYRPAWDGPAPDYAAHRDLAFEVASRGATLLLNDGTLPIPPDTEILVIAPRPGSYGAAPQLGEILGRRHPGVRSVEIPERPSPEAFDDALQLAGEADVVVVGVYHWQGSFPVSIDTLLRRLAALDAPLVIVSLGNPDILRHISVDPAAYLAVYGYRAAELEAAAALLLGRVLPRGKLPVAVQAFPVGYGLNSW